jgi:hypothetical protein
VQTCTKADILDATWWRYKAATQDCMVAKCKVLTMFYHGVFKCDIHMYFAGEYIRKPGRKSGR